MVEQIYEAKAESLVDSTSFPEGEYDPDLETKFWGFIKEHDRVKKEYDLIVIQNKRGRRFLVIPKQTENLDLNTRVRIITHPSIFGRSRDPLVSAILVDPIDPKVDKRILVDRRPPSIQEQFPLVPSTT